MALTCMFRRRRCQHFVQLHSVFVEVFTRALPSNRPTQVGLPSTQVGVEVKRRQGFHQCDSRRTCNAGQRSC